MIVGTVGVGFGEEHIFLREVQVPGVVMSAV